jgi:hypothetical protein
MSDRQLTVPFQPAPRHAGRDGWGDLSVQDNVPDDDDVQIAEHLRSELVNRIRCHPVRTWSTSLLLAVIGVIDLGTGGIDDLVPDRIVERPILRIVR